MHAPWLCRQRVPVFLGLLVLLTAVAAGNEPTRVLPEGERPADHRLDALCDLNGYFPMTPCASPAEWQVRAERVRRQILVACGLWPMPTATPAHATIHGAVDREEYTVEKVFFESFPGHFVTGSLYRPKGRTGRVPGVLCPHGHWANGRFHAHTDAELRAQIASGAETRELEGRHPVQARCVQLARMGCIVFHYDMVGYADSVQLAHRPGSREAMNTAAHWGFFSPQAELRLQNMMGLQTYNSIRALDFLLSLPEVDPQRVGVTGCSGGGTQTFILTAVDPRPTVAFPAVMVSTAMQGGCTCENACYLRVGAGNVDFAALAAPRPLGMTAADDWTKEMPTKGFPELSQHYAMLGVPDRVALFPYLQFPHNYNAVSRAAMYGWFNRHLGLGLPEPVAEGEYRPLTIAEMSVWDDAHPKPAGGDDYERSLLDEMTADAQQQLGSLVPQNADTLARFRKVVGGAIDVMVGRGLPTAAQVAVEAAGTETWDACRLRKLRLRNVAENEEVPAILLEPSDGFHRLAIWLTPAGKAALLADGRPRPAVSKLLASGVAVLGLDLLGQGESTVDGSPMTRNRMTGDAKKDWAGYAGYTYGYNHPVFAQRVHDILLAVAAAREQLGAKEVLLVGMAGTGHWAAAARAQAGAAIDRAAIDTAGFRFARLQALDDIDFWPGGAKYLDLPGVLSLSAPEPLWLAGEGAEPAVVGEAYRAAGAVDGLTVVADRPADAEESAVEWLVGR